MDSFISATALQAAAPDSPFATLTRLCLNVICSHLPLIDLIKNVARVNHHWRACVRDYCHTQMRSLEITQSFPAIFHNCAPELFRNAYWLINTENGRQLFPDPPPEQYSVDLPELENSSSGEYDGRFTLSIAEHLTSFFSYSSEKRQPLQSLIFQQLLLNDAALDGLLHLLSHWQDSLVSLKINVYHIKLTNSTKKQPLCRLFACINQLHRLEHLTIDICSRLDLEPDLAALAWLREFHFTSNAEHDIFYRALCRYASDNSNLRLLDYEPKIVENNQLDPHLLTYTRTRKGRQVARHFIRMFFPISYNPFRFAPVPPNFSQNFPSLTTITLPMYLSEWWKNMREFARLHRLIHLEVKLVSTNTHIIENEGLPPPLFSVLYINLEVPFTDHAQLASLQLGHLFPRLQVLELDYKPQCVYEAQRQPDTHPLETCRACSQAAESVEFCTRDIIQELGGRLSHFGFQCNWLDL